MAPEEYILNISLEAMFLGKCKPIHILAIIHYDSQHNEVPCAVCGVIITKSKMARHIAQKHTAMEDRKFKCTFCPKAFISSKGLKDHVNTHTGEKPYICKFCGKGSASFGSHRGHERSHEGYKRTK